jgi:hypothetical protein
MKVAIVGSRDFAVYDELREEDAPNANTYYDYKLIEDLVLAMVNEDYVVSGGATGADSWGEEFARRYNRGRIIHAAHWEKHGKAAGPIRNALIVKDADILFAFYTDRTTSRGTLNCVSQARKKGIDVYEYDAKTNRWFINDALAPECFHLDYKAAIEAHRP